MGTCSWEPVAGNLAWEPLPENLAWEPACWEPCFDTSSLKPLLEMSWDLLGKTCSWKSCLGNLGTLLGNLFLETSSWKHLLETLFWEPCFAWKNMFLENLLGKRFLGTLKTVPEIRACKTCSWEPCLGTLFLGTLFLGTSSWEPCLGTSS